MSAFISARGMELEFGGVRVDGLSRDQACIMLPGALQISESEVGAQGHVTHFGLPDVHGGEMGVKVQPASLFYQQMMVYIAALQAGSVEDTEFEFEDTGTKLLWTGSLRSVETNLSWQLAGGALRQVPLGWTVGADVISGGEGFYWHFEQIIPQPEDMMVSGGQEAITLPSFVPNLSESAA